MPLTRKLGMNQHQILVLRAGKGMSGFEMGLRAPSIKDIYATPEAWIKDLPESERHSVYFTMSTCIEDRSRIPVAQDVIHFDVDNIELRFNNGKIDKDYLTNYARIVCRAIGVEFSQTGVLFSGHGIQFMVGSHKEITEESYFDETRNHYGAICDRIDLALGNAGLVGKADRAVWSTKRVMRYPNTLNTKEGREPIWGFLLQSVIEHVDFDVKVSSRLPDLKVEDFVSDTVVQNWPLPDTETILSECKFLSWATTCPQNVSEPEWYAMLSITARFPDGRALSHMYSENHKNYSFGETEYKIKQALDSSGPRTCSNIEKVSGGKCIGCKHYKTNIVTPLFIEGPNFIRTQNTGFHSIFTGDDGKVRIGKPCYEDLRRFFYKEYNYVSTADIGLIRKFNGKYFEEVSIVEVEAYALNHFDPRPTSNTRREFIAQVRLKEMVPGDFFQTSTVKKVNFQNGVLDITTNEFRPHSKEFGFMSVLGCDYDQNATAPRFTQFVSEVLGGDPELINVVQEFLGYAFSGMECKFQKAMVFFGSGENGKSVLLEVMRLLLGEGYSSLSVKAMANDQNRALLEGKLVNIAEENSRDAFKDTELLKNFIRGGEITVKKVYHPPYEFRNQAKLLMAVNELPITFDATHGFFRSLIIVPFDQIFSFEKGNRDPDLLSKLQKELPGIFNWIMEGYHRLIKQNQFTIPKVSVELLENYKMRSNPFESWCEEVELTVVPEKIFLATRVVYLHFKEYCSITNQYCPSERQFVQYLEKKVASAGFVMDRSRRIVDGKRVSLVTNIRIEEIEEF